MISQPSFNPGCKNKVLIHYKLLRLVINQDKKMSEELNIINGDLSEQQDKDIIDE